MSFGPEAIDISHWIIKYECLVGGVLEELVSRDYSLERLPRPRGDAMIILEVNQDPVIEVESRIERRARWRFRSKHLTQLGFRSRDGHLS